MKKTEKPRRMGRPPKGAEAMLNPITIRFPKEMLEAIDAIQSSRMDRPERGQVIRELVAEALAVRGRQRKRETK